MKARHLEPEQFDRLLRGLKKLRKSEPWALAIEIMARTGMRTCELLALRPETDVQHIRKGGIYVRAAKGSLSRTAPVPQDFAALVRLKFKLPTETNTTDSLSRTLRHEWARLRFLILGQGFDHCSLHGIRASYAVVLYKRGGQDLMLVKNALGHKAISSTQAYLRLFNTETEDTTILRAMEGSGLLTNYSSK